MEPRGRELRSGLDHDQIRKILGEPVTGSCPQSISSVSSDDRQLPADLFVAICGNEFDATTRIPQAISRGARGIVSEKAPSSSVDSSVPQWHVKNARLCLALLEQTGAGSPGNSLRVFGITGTNGKSTTVQYLSSILKAAGGLVGWMTTVESCIASNSEPSRVTTESPAVVADALARHVAAQGTDMVLEISSHAIDQHRIAGVPLVGAAITSLGRDHLDYHETVEKYHDTKFKLRDLCVAGAPFLRPDVESGQEGLVRFFIEGPDHFEGAVREVTAEILEMSLSGSLVRIRSLTFEGDVKIPQPGLHNVSNALCAIGLADACGIAGDAIISGIDSCPGVPGRLEPVQGAAGRIFIDFAHTPDAIEAVLDTIGPLVKGRLLVVFGCGGDRDPGKRPLMGAAVAKHADYLFVTSDNPRSESPSSIIEQVLSGIPAQIRATAVRVEEDRRQAISAALAMLEADDIVVIAGKGHENFQEISGVKIPFSDHEVVRELLDHDQEGELVG